MAKRKFLAQWGLCEKSGHILHRDLLAENIEDAVRRAGGGKPLDRGECDYSAELLVLCGRTIRFVAHVQAHAVGIALLDGKYDETPFVTLECDGFTLACTEGNDMYGSAYQSLIAIPHGEQANEKLARRLRLQCLPPTHLKNIWDAWTGLVFYNETRPCLKPYNGPLSGEYFNLIHAAISLIPHLPPELACKLSDLINSEHSSNKRLH